MQHFQVGGTRLALSSGLLFTKETASYRYRNLHFNPKMVQRPSEIYNKIPLPVRRRQLSKYRSSPVAIWYRSMLPDSKVQGANMGRIWGRQDQDGPHIGPMNFTVWKVTHALWNYVTGAGVIKRFPDNKVHGANVGPRWDRQGLGGPHVGHMNFVIWVVHVPIKWRWNIWMNTWWYHQMKTFSALQALCAGNSPVTDEFPSKRPVKRSFDVFFDLRLNKRLSKQTRRRWLETPSRSLWRHCNEIAGIHKKTHRYITLCIFDGIYCLSVSQSIMLPRRHKVAAIMMTASNGNIFRVTGPLCGAFTSHRWIPLKKASNAELWCFLWSAPEQTVE